MTTSTGLPVSRPGRQCRTWTLARHPSGTDSVPHSAAFSGFDSLRARAKSDHENIRHSVFLVPHSAAFLGHISYNVRTHTRLMTDMGRDPRKRHWRGVS